MLWRKQAHSQVGSNLSKYVESSILDPKSTVSQALTQNAYFPSKDRENLPEWCQGCPEGCIVVHLRITYLEVITYLTDWPGRTRTLEDSVLT